MNRVSFSDETVSISYVWKWYQDIKSAIIHYETKVIRDLLSGEEVSRSFWGMTPTEITGYFSEHKIELENLVNLEIIASAEAAIRIDYLTRVYKRQKDGVSRGLRILYQQKGVRARLRIC